MAMEAGPLKANLKRLDNGELRDETKMTALYAEFAEADRTLAEAGMADYAAGLAQEDDTL